MDSHEMIHQYMLGNLDDESVRELDRRLSEDRKLRRKFAQVANIDSGLREASLERSIEEVQEQSAHLTATGRSPRAMGLRVVATCAAIAASTLIVIGIWNQQPATVATLTSSEDAAWVSTLPTSIGSGLTAGTLDLKLGIATLQFHSGAELTMEAPAQLELVSKMRTKLNSGTAVMDVPDSATGFVLETPDGYAIDFGTQFAVTVDSDRKTSDFELIEGEIEVHQPRTGQSLRLTQVGSAASVSTEALYMIEEPSLQERAVASGDTSGEVIRLSTQGRCATALQNERRRKKAVRSGYLYASHTNNGKWDMRSYIGFDLGAVNLDLVANATIRLNQVQSYRGSAALLPKTNRFAIYGLTNPARADWNDEPDWDGSPTPEDGVLLATFELPRSRMRGSIEIESAQLFEFLREHGGGPVTFLLTRETGRIEGTGPAMPHMFASDQHPEAVGPLLELALK